MNLKLIKLLAVVCGVLLLVVLLEWLYFYFIHAQLIDEISKVKTEPYQADELPMIDLEQKAETSFKAMVERPLFTEGRRELISETEDTETKAMETSLQDWQLIGIYSTDKGLTALFTSTKRTADKKTSLKLVEGDELAGRKLVEIKPESLVLEQHGQKKILLLRDIKPKKKITDIAPKTENVIKQQ